MSAGEERFDEYIERLKSAVNERCIESSHPESGGSAFREETFTAVLIETLEDLGQVAGGEIAFVERRFGRSIGRINGWWVDEENGEIDLYTTIYRGQDGASRVPASEISQAVTRALRVYEAAVEGHHTDMEPASPAYDAMQRLNEIAASAERIRVIVLVDGVAADAPEAPDARGNIDTRVDVWDLRRIYRADSSGLPYEPIEIDIAQRWGAPLPCLRTPNSGADYVSYLAILPGELLSSLYHEFGPRLLELNVRSFLQARGRVNKGIRDTLRSEPFRFMAYNNGISATAEHLEFAVGKSGGMAISKLTGLQIVNGGQTVASIHRAALQDKADLRQVYVQAKITIVRPEQIETLVPLVSRFANTQNRVNEADFSANHGFHVAFQKRADTIWTPGEQTRWFYERARGQYQVAKAREGNTPARAKRFDAATPTKQRIDKVDLAKYLNAWEQLPHIVSRGGQKNFVLFMDRLAVAKGPSWQPDADYYKGAIAKALIYKAVEKAARSQAMPSYRAQAVVYTVSVLSYRTAGRIDLTSIWNAQEPSSALVSAVSAWLPKVHPAIIESAGARNVTEWCKKEECWRHIQTLDLIVPSDLERELSEGQLLPTVGDPSARRASSVTPHDRENIARVMQVSPDQWLRLVTWGASTGVLAEWQVGIASSLAGYAATGWNKVPSTKQASQAVKILQAARDEGFWTEHGTDDELPTS